MSLSYRYVNIFVSQRVFMLDSKERDYDTAAQLFVW